MRCTQVIVALGMIFATSPVTAAEPEFVPGAIAPTAPPDARYCLRLEPETGSRIETIHCETREGWAELGLDVDKEWAEEGVRVET
jgi:hypothetical protein